MAKDKPLSFLNHNLKIGNSLIGSRLEDIGKYPFNKKVADDNSLFALDENFRETVILAIKEYEIIKGIRSEHKIDIQEKQKHINAINMLLDPYKKLCDFHTSLFFGESISDIEYNQVILTKEIPDIRSNPTWFHWDLEFTNIFISKGGFDIIIGNPPYIRHQNIKHEEKQYLWTKFVSGFDRADIYALFIENGLNLLCKGGELSLIVSDTWRTNSSFAPLREFILKFNDLKKVTLLDRNPFDAAVNTIIINIFNNSPVDPFFKSCLINSKLDVINESLITKPTADKDNNNISLSTSSNKNGILEIIESNAINYGDISDNQQGIHFGKRQMEYISDTPFNTEFNKKAVKGNNILPFLTNGYFYVNYDLEHIIDDNPTARPKDKFFSEVSEKILVRRIGGGRIIASIDEEQLYCLNTIQVCKLFDENYSVKFIAALLNSSIINYYFKVKYGICDVSISKLNAIPIKIIYKDNLISRTIERLISYTLNESRRTSSSTDLISLSTLVDFILFEYYFYLETKIAVYIESEYLNKLEAYISINSTSIQLTEITKSVLNKFDYIINDESFRIINNKLLKDET